MRSNRPPAACFTYALRSLAALAVSVVALLGPQASGLAAAAGDPSCSDVEVVFARGTFEAPGVGATGQAFVDALDARLGGKTIQIYGVDYPASLDFQAATNGIADAANKIETIAANCADTQILLGGYSQGAAVAGYTTTDTVPDGVTLPDGVTGNVAARDRLTRRGGGVVRHPVGLVLESSGPGCTADQRRSSVHGEDPRAVQHGRPDLLPRRH